MSGEDVGAMGFPVAHIGGILFLVATLTRGFRLLLLEAFVPDQAVVQMARHGVTITGGAPPFYSALVAVAQAADGDATLLPDLRLLKGGGAPCTPELYRQVREVLGAQLAHDYGMTEVPMIAVGDPRDDDEVLARADGRLLPFNQVRVLDPEGRAVPAGESGEVQVSGLAVCRGYTDPAETAKAFTEDGWFRTGDLGRLDETGHIEIVGRLKDLIIRKGENIAPQEIEELLAQHPAVVEVAVLGLPDPDRGERVCAVVVAAPGHEELTLSALTDWLRGRGLMPQKLPEQLELVDALPRTGLAKVAKNELRSTLAPTP